MLAIRAPRVTGSSVDITAIARSRQARSRRALRGRKCCTLRGIRSALAGGTLWTIFLLSVRLPFLEACPASPRFSHPRPASKESRHVQCRRRAMRGSHQQCPRRGQPRNGARSRGPKTPEGKARSAQNALKHGFRAQKHVVLPGEDAAAFHALEAALIEELAPEGALQSVLAQRVACAAWRLSAPSARGGAVRPRTTLPAEPRARPDPRRQRRAQLRHAAALPRWHARRALARAPHPQGAPGRGPRGVPGRTRRARSRAGPRRVSRTTQRRRRARKTSRTREPRKSWRIRAGAGR